ncbi:MAG: TonB-dependent receptor plug domain-containing protein [Bacteroidetes bacterium]|nr:TonB-dependent receptor plug domain-containing protein [Bacteroidota bacterium]
MKKTTFFFALLFIAHFSCTSTKSSTGSIDNFQRNDDIVNPDNSITLIDHLRHVSGVQIEGDGIYAKVRIRGVSSLNSSNEPLFVLNGMALPGGLSDAVQNVPVNEIKSVRVLKNAEETGFYGVRGANGVIEIRTK